MNKATRMPYTSSDLAAGMLTLGCSENPFSGFRYIYVHWFFGLGYDHVRKLIICVRKVQIKVQRSAEVGRGRQQPEKKCIYR